MTTVSTEQTQERNQTSEPNWAEAEFQTLHLGEERRNKRAKKLLHELGKNSQASINASCHGWSDTKAAYHLFNEPNVIDRKILKAHRDALVIRAKKESIVLAVQDTTELEYTNPKQTVQGAGPLNDEKRFGFYLHSTLVFTTGGVALGVLDHKIRAREPGSLGVNKNEHDKRPIEQKESIRWIEQYEKACEFQKELPDTTVISVVDRESDIYELFEATQKSGVRAKYKVYFPGIVRPCNLGKRGR